MQALVDCIKDKYIASSLDERHWRVKKRITIAGYTEYVPVAKSPVFTDPVEAIHWAMKEEV